MLLIKNKNLTTKILTIDNYAETLHKKMSLSIQVALNAAKHWFALHELKQKVFPSQSTDEIHNILLGLA